MFEVCHTNRRAISRRIAIPRLYSVNCRQYRAGPTSRLSDESRRAGAVGQVRNRWGLCSHSHITDVLQRIQWSR
jgi:hypothetical protein